MADAESLDDSEKLDRLRLSRSENIGPVTFRQLIAHYGSAGTPWRQFRNWHGAVAAAER